MEQALKCLQKNKSQRLQSANEIFKLLMTDESAFAEQSKTLEKMQPWSGSAAKGQSSALAKIVAGALAVLIFSVIIATVLHNRSKVVSAQSDRLPVPRLLQQKTRIQNLSRTLT